MMKNLPPGVRTKKYGEAYVTHSVTVGGLVKKESTFTADELCRYSLVTVPMVPLLCGSGRVKDEPRNLSGVLLVDLLDQAEIRIEEHEDPNRTYIVASGTDGYTSLFSWHELYNTSVGEGVLVVLKKDGRLLGVEEGELCLVSTRDERPGPRRVRYLKRIEVCRLE